MFSPFISHGQGLGNITCSYGWCKVSLEDFRDFDLIWTSLVMWSLHNISQWQCLCKLQENGEFKMSNEVNIHSYSYDMMHSDLYIITI